MIFLKFINKIISIFVIGSVLYALIEILWRGYTHWSMMLAGGSCFLTIYWVNEHNKSSSNIRKYTLCAILITLIELIFGVVFNVILRMDIWDYSARKFNFLGQICPLYTFFWFLLSIPAIFLCNKINTFLSKHVEN